MRYISHYSKWHNHQDRNYVEYMKRKFRYTFGNYLPQSKDAAILEIGCANGMALLSLKEMGYSNLLGVEIDEELSIIAKSFGLNVVHIDVLQFIDESDRKFDFIYMFDVLEHFHPEIIPRLLNKIFSLLETNGTLMLVVPNATSPAGSYFRYIDWTHQVSFTPTSISHLLEESGFKNIIIEDESLIHEPRRDDFHDDLAYRHEKSRFERAQLHESFARWEMSSMFGEDRYSQLVSPNIKVVATKTDQTDTSINLIIKNKTVLEFDKLIDWINKGYQSNLISRLELLENKEKNTTGAVEDITNRIDLIAKKIEEIKEKNQTLEETRLQFKDLFNHQSIKLDAFDTRLKLIELMSKLSKKSINKIEETASVKERLVNNEIEKLKLTIFTLIMRSYNKQKLVRKLFLKLKARKLRKIIEESGYFDEEYYLSENIDVKNAKMDAIKHYILYGSYEGRNPSKNFNTIEYILSHPELIDDNVNPLIHKILYDKQKNKERT